MAQAINLGGGIGPAVTAGLQGFDSGYEWNKRREQEKRAAAIDAENLRGAGIRNTNAEDQGREDREMFPDELAQLGLKTTNDEGRNKLQGLSIDQAERTERERKFADPYLKDKAVAKAQADIATAKNTRTTQDGTRAENARIAKRNKANAASRDQQATHAAQADASAERLRALKSYNEAQIQEEFGDKNAYEEAKGQAMFDETTNLLGMLMADKTGKKVTGHLNTSKAYKISGVVNSGIDKDGWFRAYDADGNVAVDFRDVDGDGQPDPIEFDTAGLTPEAIKRFMPAGYEQFQNKLAALQKSSAKAGSTKFQGDLSEAILNAQNERYGRAITTVDGKTSAKPPTQSMGTEHRKVLKETSKLMSANPAMTETQAYAIAMDHPDLVEDAIKATGLSNAGVEMYIRQQMDKYKGVEDVLTRLEILNALIAAGEAKAKDKARAAAIGGAAP